MRTSPGAGQLKFGVGLRRAHFDAEIGPDQGVDFVEVLPENFIGFGGRPRRALERARERLPVVLHGVGMSIGGPDPLNEAYLSGLADLIAWLKPPWFSDHLSYSSAFGVEYHDLLPLPFTEAAISHVVERVHQVQQRFDIPFLLENPSYYVEMPGGELPGGEMPEAEFVREVVQRADCGLLLDVNNVYVNSQNHGYDPYAFIDRMPLDRVLQLHIAGHDASGPFIVDTHGEPVIPAVLDLYAYAMQKIGPAWTLLEWDNNVPAVEVLLAENRKVRERGEAALAGAAAAQG